VVAIQEEPWTLNWGQITAEAGTFAYRSLELAVKDLASTRVEVLVTSPIHKDAMKLGAFKFPGHTEYLADFANVDDVLMLLVSGSLRVGVATGHIALKDVSAALSTQRIRSKINLLHESLLRDFGIVNPRIAVLGLNPHASDNGLMGDEEKRIIQPVVRELAAEEKMIFGPYAADGFFGSGAFKQFDGVLAMYHDQGLAPFKALSFGAGVNFTAGLPVVRTSPDHGTGFDIAGQGTANPDSFRAALYAARDIRRNRIEYRELTSNPLDIKQKDRRDDDYARRRRGE
jgi:4-hydroxythreonine-4-phosphate dehydrogenase